MVDAEDLDRTQKLLLDTGDAQTLEQAEQILAGYVLQVEVMPGGLDRLSDEAAFATIMNCAPRAFQGGVHVRLSGGDQMLHSGWFPKTLASELVATYGGALTTELYSEYPTVVLGSAVEWPTAGPCLRVATGGWSGGVVTRPDFDFDQRAEFPPAGVAAGAIAVSEAFQILRGNVRAGRRDHGVSLWRPDLDWLDTPELGPDFRGLIVPNRLHLLGLGHLGQAYVWTLGWLPFVNPGDVELLLQDKDILNKGNLATSMLASRDQLGMRKTRVVADAAETRGFRTALTERRLDEAQRVGADEPAVALVGVDNPSTRAMLGDTGWRFIVDAGLGAGAANYLDAQLHMFPGTVSPADLWSDRRPAFDEALLDQPGYRDIEKRLGDRCGAIMVAGRAVGAAFVGAYVSTLVVAELVRYYAEGAVRFDALNTSLRDLSMKRALQVSDWAGGENLGWTELG